MLSRSFALPVFKLLFSSYFYVSSGWMYDHMHWQWMQILSWMPGALSSFQNKRRPHPGHRLSRVQNAWYRRWRRSGDELLQLLGRGGEFFSVRNACFGFGAGSWSMAPTYAGLLLPPIPGVGILRLFSASEVALSGFDKTWDLNLHFIMITEV